VWSDEDICGGCMDPVAGVGRASVDVGVSAVLELVDKLCYLGDMLGVGGMLVWLWRPRFELDGVSSGSWCHCLPVGICHWWWEGDCAAVVCEVVCCIEVGPGP